MTLHAKNQAFIDTLNAWDLPNTTLIFQQCEPNPYMNPPCYGVLWKRLIVTDGDTGKGTGDRATSLITAEADKQGIELALRAVPLEIECGPNKGQKIPRDKLVALYEKYGFVLDADGKGMRRAARSEK